MAGHRPAGDPVPSGRSLRGSVNRCAGRPSLAPRRPLDAAHSAGACFGGLRRWWPRLRGRPDPGPADTAKLLPVAYGVGAFLLLGGAVLILADIISPIRLF